MQFISYLNRVIEFSLYFLFLLVPLVFSGAPSELFEFPKMWLTFGITILIVTAWIAKMILQRRIQIQRTPLDIPILLFLASQIISTIFSIDPHVSLWGYYSRFNGGLLSVISYLLLYYAAVSNLNIKNVLNILKLSLLSGLVVAAWGLPSHFGYDPTCFIFRGNFDTSCWTEAFKPTIRIFSTLGQPAWLAAYMSVLIPISTAFALLNLQGKSLKFEIRNLKFVIPAIFALLFYACLTYTDTRGGFIGFWIANIVFWVALFFLSFRAEQSGAEESLPAGRQVTQNKVSLKRSLHSPLGSLAMTWKYFLLFNLSFLIFNFLQGLPISQINKFTLPQFINKTISSSPSDSHSTLPAGALGGTDSGKIRLLVWRGAIDAWRANPVIGTGVETFAFAYYKHKPIGHNLTSEWDYLYNKAHNEYLNYLATTGIFGLGSYLLMIGTILFVGIKNAVQSSKVDKMENGKWKMVNIALISAYVSILISNFFGFSVVIINLYFFLIPAFVFILGGLLNPEKVLAFPPNLPHPPNSPYLPSRPSRSQYALLTALLLVMSYLLSVIVSYWQADINYNKGSNLDRSGAYQEAIVPLQNAVNAKPNEPVYRDELSINLGTLAASLYLQNDASTGAQLAQEAIKLSDQIIESHPNNIVYWKNRVRLLYTLAQGDKDNEKKYLQLALAAITKASKLAPNDPKVSYNLGILKGQIEGPRKGIEVLEKTIRLKTNYRDPYFALGLFYDETGNREKAVQALEHILKNIDPQDKHAKETLQTWQE